MFVENKSPLEAGCLAGTVHYPTPSVTIVVKGTFVLQQNGPTLLAEEQELLTGDESVGERLRYPSDFAYLKPRADLIVEGTAYAPGGKPVESLPVAFQVGNFRKEFLVFGDRKRKDGHPQPFIEMALDHRPLDVEDPQEPAGFGAINPTWPLRARKLGTFDDKWLKKRWPWFPEDADWGHQNAAPADQQVEYLRGDEPLRFENLHPEIPMFESRLPGLRVRAFLGDAEIPIHLDTLWVSPAEERLILVWRGVVNGEEGEILVVSESMGEPLRKPEEYRSRPAEEPLEPELATTVVVVPPEPPARSREWCLEQIASGKGLQGKDLSRVDLSGVDLSGMDLRETILAGAKLCKCKLAGADLRQAVLSNADLSEADLRKATLAGADAMRTNLQNADLTEADLTRADLSESVLSDAKLLRVCGERALLSHANMQGSNLEGADLTRADLSATLLVGANFRKAILKEASLESAVGWEVSLEGADLSQLRARGVYLWSSRLQGVKAVDSVWENSTLRECDLTGADFSMATFEGANLEGSQFHKANLSRAILNRAYLHGVQAVRTNLFNVRFHEADLTQADLSNSNMYHADFHRATMTDVRLEGVKLHTTVGYYPDIK